MHGMKNHVTDLVTSCSAVHTFQNWAVGEPGSLASAFSFDHPSRSPCSRISFCASSTGTTKQSTYLSDDLMYGTSSLSASSSEKGSDRSNAGLPTSRTLRCSRHQSTFLENERDAHLERLAERHGTLVLAQPGSVQLLSQICLVHQICLLIPGCLDETNASSLPIWKFYRNENPSMLGFGRIKRVCGSFAFALFSRQEGFCTAQVVDNTAHVF